MNLSTLFENDPASNYRALCPRPLHTLQLRDEVVVPVWWCGAVIDHKVGRVTGIELNGRPDLHHVLVVLPDGTEVKYFSYSIAERPKPTVSMVKRYSICTCHPGKERRAAFPPGGEGFHLDDSTYASSLHVHFSSDSRDCDGPHGLDTTWQVGESDEWRFWHDSVTGLISAHANGTLEVRDEGESARWHMYTEEGYSAATVSKCTDLHCAYDGSSVYDAFAQAAGY